MMTPRNNEKFKSSLPGYVKKKESWVPAGVGQWGQLADATPVSVHSGWAGEGVGAHAQS